MYLLLSLVIQLHNYRAPIWYKLVWEHYFLNGKNFIIINKLRLFATPDPETASFTYREINTFGIFRPHYVYEI